MADLTIKKKTLYCQLDMKNMRCFIILVGYFTLLFPFIHTSQAGTITQQNYVNDFITSDLYNELFSFYQENEYIFSNITGREGEDISITPKALLQARAVFDRMMQDWHDGSEEATIVVTRSNKNFIKVIHATVEQEFPSSTKKALYEDMRKNSSGWTALTWLELGSIFTTAALTGPKVGFDIMSGGAGATIKTGQKVILKTTKLSNNVLKNLGASKTFAITISKFFKNKGATSVKWINKLQNSATNPALWKIKKIYESNQFKLLAYIGEMIVNLNSLDTNLELSRTDLLEKIQEIEGLADLPDINSPVVTAYTDEESIISEFFVTLIVDKYRFAGTVVSNKLMVIFVNALEAGAISLVQMDGDLITSFHDAIEAGIFGAASQLISFAPVVGAFWDTFSAWNDAAETIENRFNTSAQNYTVFRNGKISRTDSLVDLYKLAVIEDTFRAVLDNNNPVKSVLWPEIALGVTPTPRLIQDILFDYTPEMAVSRAFFKHYQLCQIYYIKGAQGGAPKNEGGHQGVCNPGEGTYYSLTVKDGPNHIRGELYFDLKSDTAFYFPSKKDTTNNYSDVGQNDYFYKYIMALSALNAISGYEDKFFPHRKITQGEFIKMNSRLFYYNEAGYGNGDSLTKYYDYLSQKANIQFPLDQISKNNINTPITRGEVAHILVKILINIGRLSEEERLNLLDKIYMNRTCINNSHWDDNWGDDWDGYSSILKYYGIVNGYANYNGTGKTAFLPENDITRANVSKMILNTYNYQDTR